MLSEADLIAVDGINRRIKELQTQIAVLDNARADIYRAAAVNDAEPGTYTLNNGSVEVKETKRFDSELAMQQYPLGPNGENIELYDATISSAKAKALLSPADYEKLQKVYPNKQIKVTYNG